MVRVRKGQGAMEYLMTYGWAILVVMVVGVVMWQLGIFNIGGVTATTASGFPRLRPQLALMSMNTTGNFTGTFTNGAGGTIVIYNVSGTAGSGSCSSWTGLNTPQEKGVNFQITGSCPVTGVSGDPYEIELNVTYNISMAGLMVTHTDSGKIRGPLE